MTKKKSIDCHSCRHFFITWEPKFPYGCRAMDFKSKRLPAMDVMENSGLPCQLFEKKKRKPPPDLDYL